MVNGIALREHSHVPHSIDVVIRRSYTKSGLKQTIRSELKFLRNNQLGATNCNLEAPLIHKTSDINESLLKAGLVEICGSGKLVTEGTTVNERMVRSAKLFSVPTGNKGYPQ